MNNIFSVDVEDYYHPTELFGGVSRWEQLAPRLHIGLQFLLDSLAEHKVRGTFFILGWVAKRHARLIRSIAEEGHEIGCHSYLHRLIYSLTPQEFELDTRAAVHAIEDATGVTPRVYRAPTYSVTAKSLWALEVLASCGFTHDSSIYPIVHDRYGIPDFTRQAGIIRTASGPIVEVPVATVRLGRSKVAPVGGGAYMRIFPYRYTAAGVRRLNRSESQAACMYFHPWELDPEQPRLSANLFSRFRTYAGLQSMRSKILNLLADFSFAPLTAVYPLGMALPEIVPQAANATEKPARALTRPAERAVAPGRRAVRSA